MVARPCGVREENTPGLDEALGQTTEESRHTKTKPAVPGARGNPPNWLPVPPVMDVQCEMTQQHHEQAVPDRKEVPPNAIVDANVPWALAAVRINHRGRHTQAVKTQAQMHDGSRTFLNDDLQHAGTGFGQIDHERHTTSHGNATYDTLWQIIKFDGEQLPLEPGRHAC